MKILGIDTTTSHLALGVYDGGRIFSYDVELGRRHSALLVTVITRVLGSLGWGARDIDYFACGLGPGSFTGARVGLAATKGFAYFLKRPVVGVPTLDILAAGAGPVDRPLAVCVDAKRNLVYSGIYSFQKGKLRRRAPYRLLGAQEFCRAAPSGSLVMGDAIPLYRQQMLEGIRGVGFLEKEHWYPRGRELISLSLERIGRKQFDDPFTVEPIYLYPKECQIKK